MKPRQHAPIWNVSSTERRFKYENGTNLARDLSAVGTPQRVRGAQRSGTQTAECAACQPLRQK
jgi:hypothetical protein